MFGQYRRIKELEARLKEQMDFDESRWDREHSLENAKNELEKRIKTLLILRDDAGLVKFAQEAAERIDDIYAKGSRSVYARRTEVAREVQSAMRTAISGTSDWWDNYGKKPGEYPGPKPMASGQE